MCVIVLASAMEAAIKARTGARIWVSRQGNKVLSMLEKKSPKQELLVELEDFRSKVTKLKCAQEEVEVLLDIS